MIYWNPFEYQNEIYSLDHLHPMQWNLIQEVDVNNPARTYRIEVVFSLHTFTTATENYHDSDLHYSDPRETRTFCFDRYDKSKLLPDIIRSLNTGYVFHTGKQNFMRIDRENVTYEIFFAVRRSAKPILDLEIYVQSAYERTTGNSPKAGAYNTVMGKPIKVHKR